MVPSAPPSVSMFITDNDSTSLTMVVRWTAPAGPVTSYRITLHSGSDVQHTVPAGTLQSSFDLACDAACHGSQPSAAVQAVNAAGTGPQTVDVPGALPVVSSVTCADIGNGLAQCKLSASATTITWTDNLGQPIGPTTNSIYDVLFGCVPLDSTHVVTMTASNAAGAAVRHLSVHCVSAGVPE